MAKKRTTSAPASVPTGRGRITPGRSAQPTPPPAREFTFPAGKDPLTGFAVPAPKGIRPRGPVQPLVKPEEEESRFTLGGATQDERIGKRGITGDAVSAASLRRNGGRYAEEDEYGDGDEDVLGEPEEPEDQGPAIAAKVLQTLREEAQFSQPSALPDSAIFGPPAVAAAPSTALTPGLHLLTPTQEDTDRLWDWIRADADRGEVFFGKLMKTSQELHDLMRDLVVLHEPQMTALARSIWFIDGRGVRHHIGTTIFAPILSTERVALVHLFLRKDVRGNLANFIRPILDAGRGLVPGYHLAFFAMEPGMLAFGQQTLVPLGFKAFTMFVL